MLAASSALATTTGWIVGDVHPLIKFLNQLIKWQVGSFDLLVELLDGQVTRFDVYGLTRQVLTARRTVYGLIDSGTAVATIDKDRSAQFVPKWLQDVLTEEAQVVDNRRAGIKLLLIAQSGGRLRSEKFPEREVFGKLHKLLN